MENTARIDALESRLNNLQKAFEQAMKNQVPITEKTDDNKSEVETVKKQTEVVKEETDVVNATIDGIMTDVIPELAETDAGINETIDTILTEIIPSLMGE